MPSHQVLPAILILLPVHHNEGYGISRMVWLDVQFGSKRHCSFEIPTSLPWAMHIARETHTKDVIKVLAFTWGSLHGKIVPKSLYRG